MIRLGDADNPRQIKKYDRIFYKITNRYFYAIIDILVFPLK